MMDDVNCRFLHITATQYLPRVMAEQPGIMKFLSNPLIAAVLGIAAAKWLGSHRVLGINNKGSTWIALISTKPLPVPG